MTRPKIKKLPVVTGDTTTYTKTLCTPDGGLLRGDSLLAYKQNWGSAIHDIDYGEDHQSWTDSGEVSNKAYYRKLQQKYGLNCVRLFFYRDIRNAYNRQWFPWRQGLPMLDRAVEITAELGMTLIIDYHPVPCGKANWSHADPTTNNSDDAWLPEGLTDFGQESVDFWAEVAPRYANAEHVVYEIQNEPYQWSETYLNGYYMDKGAIAYQGDMYAFVRALAPDTPLLMWSFPQARGKSTADKDLLSVVRRDKFINYKNAAVAIHTYGLDRSSVTRLAAAKPTIITEWTDQRATANLNSFNRMMAWAEEQQLSWIMLNLEWTSRRLA